MSVRHLAVIVMLLSAYFSDLDCLCLLVHRPRGGSRNFHLGRPVKGQADFG